MPDLCFKDFNAYEKKLVIGVGSLEVSRDPTTTLTTFSLGTCIGVTIYDPVIRVGGLLHAMLPDSSIGKEGAAERPAMFVDTGLAALLEAACHIGAEKSRMQICVTGAAHFMGDSGIFNIGDRNLKHLRERLRQLGLTMAAQDVGGFASRTMHLNIGTGEVRLKIDGQTSEAVLYRS